MEGALSTRLFWDLSQEFPPQVGMKVTPSFSPAEGAGTFLQDSLHPGQTSLSSLFIKSSRNCPNFNVQYISLDPD